MSTIKKLIRGGGPRPAQKTSSSSTTAKSVKLNSPAPQSQNSAHVPAQQISLCFFLTKLPREIRDQIYEELFSRVNFIEPGVVRYTRLVKGRLNTYQKYSYHWEGGWKALYTLGLMPPAWKATPETIYHGWTSKATAEQLAILQDPQNKNMEKLPDTFRKDVGLPVEHYVYNRGEYGYDILNRIRIPTERLSPVALFRTCKQIEDEATQILYSRNTFCFDTSYNYDSEEREGFHSQEDFDEAPQRIPGTPCRDGQPPTALQVRITLDKLFHNSTSGYQPRFIQRDPIVRFFRMIGKKNASMLRNINIAGYFKTRPIGFSRLLSTYTLIINDICLNLRKVVLHCYDGLPQWDDDEGGQIEEWKIDQAVKNLVLGLPRLKELQLGDYYKPYLLGDQWGKSIKWIDMVKDQKSLDILRAERSRRVEAKEERLIELSSPVRTSTARGKRESVSPTPRRSTKKASRITL